MPPVTLAEMTLQPNDQDYYDTSLVDGYNINIGMRPNRPAPGSGQYWCKEIRKCKTDMNVVCPEELKVKNGQGTFLFI